MHELALANGLVDAIREAAASRGFARVRRVGLEIGALSHVEPEAIAFCFDVVTRGTLAEGAELAIARPPGRALCVDCADEVEIAARGAPCPRCAGHRLLVRGGEELRLVELEVV